MVTSRRWVPAPAATVYSTIIDAERYPQWLIGARHVRVTRSGWPDAGASFEHEVGAGPVQVHDVTTSLGGEPGHSLALRVRARPLMEAHVHFEIRTSGDDRSCEVEMVETPVGSLRHLTRLFSPLIRMRNDRSLERLASLVAPR